MERKEVYNRINGERDYQDLKWNPIRESEGIDDSNVSIAEWISYMEIHIAKAKKQLYQVNKEGGLDEMRKVTALGVRCLEVYGCPERIKE